MLPIPELTLALGIELPVFAPPTDVLADGEFAEPPGLLLRAGAAARGSDESVGGGESRGRHSHFSTRVYYPKDVSDLEIDAEQLFV